MLDTTHHSARFDYLYRHLKLLTWASCLFTGLLLTSLWKDITEPLISIWLTSQTILIGYRFILLKQTKDRLDSRRAYFSNNNQHLLNAWLEGFSWSFAYIAILSSDSSQNSWLIPASLSLLIMSSICYAIYLPMLALALIPAVVGLISLLTQQPIFNALVSTIIALVFSSFLLICHLTLQRLKIQGRRPLASSLIQGRHQQNTQSQSSVSAPQSLNAVSPTSSSVASKFQFLKSPTVFTKRVDPQQTPQHTELLTRLAISEQQCQLLEHKLKHANERLDHLKLNASHSKVDPLTRLQNRTSLFIQLPRILEAYQHAQGRRLALFHINIDRFKAINEHYGYAVGDQILKEIGTRLYFESPSDNDWYRVDGDEFIYLVDVEQIESPTTFANRLIDSINKPIYLQNDELIPTASVGISTFPDQASNLKALIVQADLAMAHAKHYGGNRSVYYDTGIAYAPNDRLILETHLRKALNTNEFEIFYQPKLNLTTYKITSAEALVRWNHPTLGEVKPTEFIPLAEQTGMITSLGFMVLEQACRQAQKWRADGMGDIRISVNLSTQQLACEHFPDRLKHLLDEIQLPPSLLELELTESLLLEDAKRNIDALMKIKSLGVDLAIDDFGTGFSSLSYLKQLPVSTVKIDQSFVKDIPSSKEDMTIINTIITMAHELKIRVVAEGVETQDQHDVLHDNGCDELQGYFISEPIPYQRFPDVIMEFSASY